AARPGGIVGTSCDSCHGGVNAMVTLTAAPSEFLPNDDVTFTVTITRPDANLATGGVFVAKPATGELRLLPGEGLRLVTDYGLTHEEPKEAQAGRVTFRFAWHAPSAPGGVRFDVFALAANGDGRSSGDLAGSARFETAFGCT